VRAANELHWLVVRENMRRYASARMHSVFDVARGY
jgi:hypothetical protein